MKTLTYPRPDVEGHPIAKTCPNVVVEMDVPQWSVEGRGEPEKIDSNFGMRSLASVALVFVAAAAVAAAEEDDDGDVSLVVLEVVLLVFVAEESLEEGEEDNGNNPAVPTPPFHPGEPLKTELPPTVSILLAPN